MAIQFDCPYCTASIRVPDSAAGKKGTCPQCQTKLVVPTPKGMPTDKESPKASPASPKVTVTAAAGQMQPPEIPHVTHIPKELPGANAVFPNFGAMPMTAPSPAMPFPGMPPQFGQPVYGQPVVAPTPPGFPAPIAGMYPPHMTQSAPEESEEDRILAMRAERRRKQAARKQAIIWSVVAVVLISLLAGGGYALINRNKPSPWQANLTASRLADGKLDAVKIQRDEIKIDVDLLDNALKQLEKRPVKLFNDKMRLQIQGKSDGLVISLAPGASAELVELPIAQSKLIADWVKRDGAKVADRNRERIGTAATEFVQAWIEAEARGDKKPDFNRFHEDLGLRSLAMGLGSEAVAVIKGVEHRCIAEQSGSLFFLLPQGTDRFELHGREDSKKRVFFPGQFKVRIAETVAPAKKKTPEDSDGDDNKPSKSVKDAFGRPVIDDSAMPSEESN